MENYIIIIVGFVCTLIPTLITLWLNEKVKGSVKNSFDEKLSQFQIELNHLKTKENFKFTKLHEKRFEVLQESYKYLNNNLNLLVKHISPFKFTRDGEDYDENEKKASNEYRDAHNEFLEYFNFNSIYFDEETEALLRSFFQESGEIFNAYDQRQLYKSMGETLEKEDRLASAFAYKKIPKIIHPLKKEIETKFRKLLGE
ncbi:hypothetical protein [Flavobacterium limnophilum]|uniref:hypothetical protein n=1 Tax=Flavobacterium limnophilum TaxID=3003262 RepID=UPI002483187C|nr:hypothetical protein [Flavobacterium limnophilum]